MRKNQDGPTPIVEAMPDHLRRELRSDYPEAKFRITKRAILITFYEPLPGREDPSWSGWSGPASPACGSRTPRPKPGILGSREHPGLLTTKSDPKALR
jgi:hypothetical protein